MINKHLFKITKLNFFSKKYWAVLVLSFLIFNQSFAAENKNSSFNQKECVQLNDSDKSYKTAINRLTKVPQIDQWNSLLNKNNSKMALLDASPEFINQRCFWVISLHEDHNSHLVFWKTFVVQIDGNEIYERDLSDDSLHRVEISN